MGRLVVTVHRHRPWLSMREMCVINSDYAFRVFAQKLAALSPDADGPNVLVIAASE